QAIAHPRVPASLLLSVRADGDDRNWARRLLLVGAVAIAVVVVDDLPKPVVVGIRRLEDPRCALPSLACDLNLDVGVGSEVVEPRWRAIGAPVGGDHEVVVAVAGVDEAVCPGRA